MYSYHIELINGFWNVNISFQKPAGHTETIVQNFMSELSARTYAHNHEKEFLTDWLHRFISQADLLYYKGNPNFYKTTRRGISLTNLINYKKVAGQNTLGGLCYDLLGYEEDLRNILPAPNNPNYSNRLSELNRVLSECRRVRRIKLRQIA